MKKSFLNSLFVFVLASSCSTDIIIQRSPSSSELKYPEFLLKRNFLFNEKNCEISPHPFLSKDDYKFDSFKKETGIDFYASSKDLKNRYKHLYQSSKRLKNRLYLKNNEWILPINGNDQIIARSFLNSIANHVEQAFSMGVVEYLFYPDMGHMHFYLPKENKNTESLWHLEKDLKAVYHTAERLMMKDGETTRDPIAYRKFRYRTRNLIGGFDKRGTLEVHYAHRNKMFNTLHEIPGYPEYEKFGKVLYVSANKNGCIGYKHKGKIHYFDISFTY